jgi:molybdate transport system regulatory protein
MKRANLSLKARIMLGEVRALGPGKADLLELIEKKGSISAAAKAMAMSYRRAWLLVEEMNGAFKTPLVTAATGGAGGGGAQLTQRGRDVLALYRRMQAALDRAALPHLTEIRKHL